MRKRSNLPPAPPTDDSTLIQNLIGLGDFSARKSYYPELLHKIDELEAEKERYKWLFEHALHGIFQARLDGPVTAANPAIARICGYAGPDAFRAAVSDIGQQLIFDTEDYRRLRKLLRRDGQRVGFETRLRRADGTPVEVSMNLLLKDAAQGLLEAFVQDITERKRAQAALTRLNAELEQRVQARTCQLRAAKQEAEEANASKDKYLAAASHDLLQPMNAARLLVSTLQERPLGIDDRQLVERIHVALLGAEELLTDLLDIAKLDARAVTPDRCDFAINDLIRALSTEFEPVAAEAGLTLRTLPCALSVHSDPRLLIRILRNLISNAIRYTPSGRVLLGCRRRGTRLEIQVCDSGSGIPAAKMKAIFQEFQQLHNGQPGRSKGVGLGLAIVERIAAMLDHPIAVRSRLGRGSCFSVTLPLSRGPAPVPLAMPDAAAADLSGCRVLVIENEEAILTSMRALLQAWGCRVETARDHDQAREAWRRLAPDILLADYHLDAGVTGTQVVTGLFRHFGQSRPAVMITAERGDAVRREFKDLGLVPLNKPVKPGKLRALMSHLLHPPT